MCSCVRVCKCLCVLLCVCVCVKFNNNDPLKPTARPMHPLFFIPAAYILSIFLLRCSCLLPLPLPPASLSLPLLSQLARCCLTFFPFPAYCVASPPVPPLLGCCLDSLSALTFNVIIFTMMLDGIKTRLNTNKRQAGSQVGLRRVKERGGEEGREHFLFDTLENKSIRCTNACYGHKR